MAYDAFLKIDGIEGSDQTNTPIEVLSFTIGVTTTEDRTSAGGGLARTIAGLPQPLPQDLRIVKHTDGASPALFAAAATGKHFAHAELMLLPAVQPGADAAPQPFMKWTLTGVLIDSVQWKGSENGDVRPLEEVSIDFQELEVAVGMADGSVRKAGFNFLTRSLL